MINAIISLSFLISLQINAATKSYQENDVYEAFITASRDGNITKTEASKIIYIASNPYAPTESHAGGKFLEALAWYNDITVGNKNGRFTLRELNTAFAGQLEKYLGTLSRRATKTERISAWKMLQKLKILEKTIIKSGKTYYSYRSKELSQISYKNEWNRKNTIRSSEDFEKE